MIEKDTRDENGALADLLQQEAEQTRPAFSESLHARICRAVEESSVAELPRPAARPRLVRVGIAAVVAATLAIGVFCLARHGAKPNTVAGPGSTDHDSVAPEPDEDLQPLADMPGNAAVDIGLLVDSTLTNRQWAYLDHDAQLAATMLLDQLPRSIAWPAEEP